MLKIIENDKEKSIGFTIENNLCPTTEEAVDLCKKIMFERGASRFYNGEYSSTFNTTPSLFDLFRYIRLNPHTLNTGMLELLDENDNIVGQVDLSKAYSGDDFKRGSINNRETYEFTVNGVLKNHLVIDVPTHACNNVPIKKIRINEENIFHVSSYRYKSLTPNWETIFRTEKNINLNIAIDGDGKEWIMCDSHLIYDGEVYNYPYTRESDFKYPNTVSDFYNTKIFNVDGEIYLINYISANQFTLTKLTLDKEKKVVEQEEPILFAPFKAYTTSSGYFHHPLTIKKIDGKFAIPLVVYSSDRYCFLYYNEDGSIAEQTSYSSCSNCGLTTFYYDIPLGADLKVRYSGSDYKILTDFNTKTMIYNGSTEEEDLKGSVRGSNAICNGYRYRSYQTTSGAATCRYLLRVPLDAESKYPLIITLDEPIEKTKDQTLKLVLDIEIE